MAAEWATAEISVLEYRDTGTFIIKLDEAVLQQLDDHIGRLRGSHEKITYSMQGMHKQQCIETLFVVMGYEGL